MEYNRMKQNNEWVIEAEHLSYTYDGNEKPALDDLNLKIRRGQKVAFMGGNGSGKVHFFSVSERYPETGKRKSADRWNAHCLYKKGTSGWCGAEWGSCSRNRMTSFFLPVYIRRFLLVS